MSTNKPAEFNFYLNTQGPRGRQGAQGPQGVSPTITIGQNNANSFTLVITDANGTFETPNLKGNLVDVSDNGTYVRYQPSDGTLYTSDLDQATTSTIGGVRFATEENLLDDISSGVAISPSDLQDYLAAKLIAGDNISITKDDETGIVTISTTGGGSGGVSSYNDLTDKPELFGTVIQNDNTLSHYVPLKAPLKESIGVDYEQDIVIENGTLTNGMLTFADDWHPMFSDTYSSFTLQGEFTLNGNEFTPNSYVSMPINVGDIVGFPGGTGADIACGHIRESDGQFIFTHLLRADGLAGTGEQSTENWANLHVTNKSASGSTLQCSAENGTSTWLSGKNITNGACYFQFRQDADGSYIVVLIRQGIDGNSYGIKTVFSSDSAKADLAQLSRVFFGGTDVLQNPQNQFFIYRNPGIDLEDITSQADFNNLTNMVNWQFPDAEHSLYVDYDDDTIKVNEQGKLYANIDVANFQEKFVPVGPLEFTSQTVSNNAGVQFNANNITVSESTKGQRYTIYGSTQSVDPYAVANNTIACNCYVSFPFVQDRYYFSGGAYRASNTSVPSTCLAFIGSFDSTNSDWFKVKYVIGIANNNNAKIWKLENQDDLKVGMPRSLVGRGQDVSRTYWTGSGALLKNGFVLKNVSGKIAMQYIVTSGTNDDFYICGEGLSVTTYDWDISDSDYVYFVTNNFPGMGTQLPLNSIGYIDANGTYFGEYNVESIFANFIPFIPTSETQNYLQLSETIPTNTSDLTNDSGFITNTVNNLTNYTPTSGLAAVATSGSYNDLTDKPTIPEPYTLPAATTTSLGGVKPDGTTITITGDGTISSVGGGSGGTTDYTALTNKPQINSVELTGNKSLTDIGAQASTDNTLTTTAKTIVGAINELVTRIAALETQVTSLNSVIDGQTGGGTDA